MADAVADAPTQPRLTALQAATSIAARCGLGVVTPRVLKDGSNLLVHLDPVPVVLRIATLTARIRGDPLPWLEREAALATWLAQLGASVMPPSDLVPPGPHLIDGWAMTAWQLVDHEAGVIADGMTTLRALDELHDFMRTYNGRLPSLNPLADDLDRAIAFATHWGLLDAARAAELRERRDELLGHLLATTEPIPAQHGDAFPRNSLVGRDGRVVWIDFEDCCSGPPIWDLAVLVRQGGGEEVAAIVRARHGEDALATALALREIQLDVWMLIHNARREGRLAPEGHVR